MFPEHAYVSLDLPALAAAAENDPTSFFAANPPPVVVDEVQYAGGLFRHVKLRVEAQRRKRGQFIHTGSQSFPLMKGVADSLAGRVGLIQLESLSLAELRRAAPSLPIEAAVRRGGYPELYESPELDAHDFYRAYVATYLERDVRALLNVGNLRDFERFLRSCALRSAQVLSKSDLARDVGISPATANQWLSVLEASQQVVLLEPWSANLSVSVTKSPKLYLADTGILCFLLNIRTTGDLLASPYLGAVWETFVFSELRKRQTLAAGSWQLFFWRDRQREVDFVIHRGGRFRLLEAKWTEMPDPRDAANCVIWPVRSVRAACSTCRSSAVRQQRTRCPARTATGRTCGLCPSRAPGGRNHEPRHATRSRRATLGCSRRALAGRAVARLACPADPPPAASEFPMACATHVRHEANVESGRRWRHRGRPCMGAASP